MTSQRSLFCPFCHEPFEHLQRCPHHDLELLPWRALRRLGQGQDGHDSQRVPLAVSDLRFGRGWVLLGSVLTCAAFMMPVVRADGGFDAAPSMLTLAITRAPKLWLVPLTACACLLVLYRRRSPHAMRGVRLAVPLMGLAPSLVVWLTVRGTREATARLAELLGHQASVQVASGSWLVWAASVPLVLGGAWLGTGRRRVREIRSS